MKAFRLAFAWALIVLAFGYVQPLVADHPVLWFAALVLALWGAKRVLAVRAN